MSVSIVSHNTSASTTKPPSLKATQVERVMSHLSVTFVAKFCALKVHLTDTCLCTQVGDHDMIISFIEYFLLFLVEIFNVQINTNLSFLSV